MDDNQSGKRLSGKDCQGKTEVCYEVKRKIKAGKEERVCIRLHRAAITVTANSPLPVDNEKLLIMSQRT